MSLHPERGLATKTERQEGPTDGGGMCSSPFLKLFTYGEERGKSGRKWSWLSPFKFLDRLPWSQVYGRCCLPQSSLSGFYVPHTVWRLEKQQHSCCLPLPDLYTFPAVCSLHGGQSFLIIMIRSCHNFVQNIPVVFKHMEKEVWIPHQGPSVPA